MTLKYKRSHLNLLLGLGIGLWIAALALHLIGAAEFVAIFAAMGLYNIVLFAYRSVSHYLTIRNEVIIKSGLWGGRIPLAEIRRVRKIGGDFFVEGIHSEIPVYTAFLDSLSLRRFERILGQYSTPDTQDFSTNDIILP